MRDDVVRFRTDGLLSKWGFGDGDMLDDLMWDNGFGEAWKELRPDDVHGLDHRVLIRCVETFVLPEVAKHHQIEHYTIGSIHNPIRLRTLDGEEVEATNPDWKRPITPDAVDVPVAAVLAIAAEETKRYEAAP